MWASFQSCTKIASLCCYYWYKKYEKGLCYFGTFNFIFWIIIRYVLEKRMFYSVFVMNCTTQKVFWFIFFLFSAGLSTQYLVWRWLLKCITQQGLLHIMPLLWKQFKFISHKVVLFITWHATFRCLI